MSIKGSFMTFFVFSFMAYAVMRWGNLILMTVSLPIAFTGMLAGLINIWRWDNEKKIRKLYKRDDLFGS